MFKPVGLRFVFFAFIPVLFVYYAQAQLKCFAGTWESGNWTVARQNVTCDANHPWCKSERHYDSSKNYDKRIFTCATDNECKDAFKYDKKDDKKNNKQQTNIRFSTVKADYDSCCQKDFCNSNSAGSTFLTTTGMLFCAFMFFALKHT
ncbi:hypothetical protein M3Y98_00834400 [Aphelenchoides besseyi]|nr:hypothetical protein M3Y98_00834400 [Aphelenchoides besseyi]KAI6195450.1 hypothetical protein M3Y96_01232700 [Aphelenchoides besseyi]